MAQLQSAFDRLAAVGRSPRRTLGRIGLYIRREAQRALRTRLRTWGVSSGRLSRSLAMVVDKASVTVGSNLVYAAVQQLGGTIRPRSGKFLAIPVSRQLQRRGVWPRDLPRDSMKYVPNAEIRIGSHSWTGPALVAAQDETVPGRKRSDGSRGADRVVKRAGEVMFALVRKSKIRGRPYLSFDSRAHAFAMAQLELEFRDAAAGRGHL